MPKIGIDARLAYYRQGGITQYIYNLLKYLPQLDKQSDYTVFHSRKDKRDLTSGDNQHRAICWTPAHHRFERHALALETVPHRLDLLHSPDFIPPLKMGFRSVITVHDLTFLHYPEFLTEDSRRYYNGGIRWAVQQAEHILTDSEATRQDVLSLLNVSPEKVTTVLLGISDEFKPAKPEAIESVKKKHFLPETYILFVGTFEPRKNLRNEILPEDWK